MKYLYIGGAEIQVIEADTFFKRFLGLMGRDLPSDHAMLLTPCASIHTCFMRFPIDIVFLDTQFSVVDMVDGMKPWRCSKTVSKAKHVLEMRAGMAEKLEIAKGNRILLECRKRETDRVRSLWYM